VSWQRFDTGRIFAGAQILRAAAVRDRYVLFGQRDQVPPDPPTPIIAIGDPPPSSP
jgi:hypothetical protein